jgi:crossover junction endodeoxyribonuclease RuvC
LSIKEMPKLLDATDALAVALCHHFQKKALTSKASSWESFAKENQHRIK